MLPNQVYYYFPLPSVMCCSPLTISFTKLVPTFGEPERACLGVRRYERRIRSGAPPSPYIFRGVINASSSPSSGHHEVPGKNQVHKNEIFPLFARDRDLHHLRSRSETITIFINVLREDINWKKTFSFGHCPNYLTPPPHDPNLGNLALFFWKSKFKIWKSV